MKWSKVFGKFLKGFLIAASGAAVGVANEGKFNSWEDFGMTAAIGALGGLVTGGQNYIKHKDETNKEEA